jgi:uncharacterized protein (DUF1015 family)
MADVAPLKPLRYAPESYARIVAPPYDVIDAEMRAELGSRDPHNVVHIDLPVGEGAERYANAKRLFERWQAEGVLVRDEQPSYWRYRQTFTPPGDTSGARLTRSGFLALVRAVPFSDRVVLPHERTLTGPKEDRIALSRATRAALSPGFMLYSDPERALDADLDAGEPFAQFETDDGVRHEIVRVVAPERVRRVTEALRSSTLLIADGHHRYETAVMLARELDEQARRGGANVSARGEHLYTFALLANGDDPSLVVFATHRLVHSLSGFDFEALVTKARELFDVVEAGGDEKSLMARLAASGAERPTLCAVAPKGRAVLLRLRVDADLGRHPVLGKRPEAVRNTDVALLHDTLLEHALGITKEAQAAKTNLKYLQEPQRGIEALERGEGQVLFLMNPTPVSVVRRVAEAGEVMPQKSTFFYPKVPSGLLFHTLDPTREVGCSVV